jgi:hypothetical protein
MSVRGTRLFALAQGLTAAAVVLGGSYRCVSLSYPPRNDQQTYLEAAQLATQGVFPDRAPLYSVWMAAWSEITGWHPHRTFQVEKLVTTGLLALTTGLVAGRIFGGATGVLAGAWVMNCKYLLHESNGSHAFAAVLWMTGLLVLLSRLGPRRALTLVLLFLATQVRIELWLPFLMAAGVLVAREWKVDRQEGWRRLGLTWASALLIGVMAWSVLHAHTYKAPVQVGVRLAFQQGFSVTYVERHGLADRFPHAWTQWEDVMREALPGADDLASGLRLHPGTVFGHVAYQAGLSLRALSALVLAFEQPWLMLALVATYLGGPAWRDLAPRLSPPQPDDVRDAAAASAVLVVLVPISCVLRVAARNYIPLIPAELLALVLLLRAGQSAMVRRRATSA